MRRVAFSLLVLAACSKPPREPDDIDLGGVKAGFHCEAPKGPASDEACRAIAGFEAGKPISAWPQKDVELWIGTSHCVQPTATADYATFEAVYLRPGKGSAPSAAVDPARILDVTATFATPQVERGSDPSTTESLEKLARGEAPDPSKTADLFRLLLTDPPASTYRTLVRTLSGRTAGDGTADNGIWFLRAGEGRLYLVAPKLQGGCATELFRAKR